MELFVVSILKYKIDHFDFVLFIFQFSFLILVETLSSQVNTLIINMQEAMSVCQRVLFLVILPDIISYKNCSNICNIKSKYPKKISLYSLFLEVVLIASH